MNEEINFPLKYKSGTKIVRLTNNCDGTININFGDGFKLSKVPILAAKDLANALIIISDKTTESN